MRLFPRNDAYYELLERLVGHLRTASGGLDALIARPEGGEATFNAIQNAEEAADRLTIEIQGKLDASFIAPFDRADVHRLTNNLEEMIDVVEDVAESVRSLGLVATEPAVHTLAVLLVRESRILSDAIGELREPRVVLERLTDLRTVREEGDAVYAAAISKLFEGDPDPMHVIRQKSLYDAMDRALALGVATGGVLEAMAHKEI